VLLRETITHATWCAERELQQLVAVKAATHGLNTDQLGRRNCHIYLGERFVERAGNWAGIGVDLTEPAGPLGMRMSIVDINLALLPGDRFSRIIVAEA
jgi:hypothetical protein